MKIVSTLLLFMALTSIGTIAQAQDTNPVFYRASRPNSVSTTLLGHGFVYSLDYDRCFNKWVGLGGGFSSYGDQDDTFTALHSYLIFYPVGGKTTSLFLKGGVSYAPRLAQLADGDGILNENFNEDEKFYGHLGMGVEYRKAFLFRFAMNTFMADKAFALIWTGLTFGYSF